MVATSKGSSLVLLEDPILEFPAEYPADSEGAHAEHMWYLLRDVVGLESLSASLCPLLPPAHLLACIEGIRQP